MKKLVFVMATMLATSTFATGKVNNGILPMNRLFQCIETNPKNPDEAIRLHIDELVGSGTLLKVYSGSNKKPFISERVEADKNIRCILPCAHYNDMDGNLIFGATILPKKITGHLVLDDETVQVTCTQPKNR